MQFRISNRWTGETQFIAEIDCAEDAPHFVKVGLAVKWGVKNDAILRGADLSDADLRDADLSDAILSGAVLRGADLSGAVLRGAVLRGADLRGADLTDADLSGAVLRDAILRGAILSDSDGFNHKIKRLIASVERISDGREAHIFETKAGEIVGKWGCRIMTLANFAERVEGYDHADKRAETLNIIAFVRAEAERLGVGKAEAA